MWCIRSSVADLGTALSVATDADTVYNIVITDKNPDMDSFWDHITSQKFNLDLLECSELTNFGTSFSGCDSCFGITLPSSITTIEEVAFMGCKNLSYVTLPEGLTEICLATFYGCTNLSKINIPTTVDFIGVSVFWGCEKLSEVVIPAGVKNIGNNVFGSNYYLTKLTFEDPTGWYKTSSKSDWEAKTGGEAVDLSNPATNAANFGASSDNRYADYYWYKQ